MKVVDFEDNQRREDELAKSRVVQGTLSAEACRLTL